MTQAQPPTARVLLVEDDVRLAREVQRFLERRGLSVCVRHRGDGVVPAAADADLVVLDWMLPGVDGLALCQALREAGPVPILMLTAREGDAAEVQALQAGADDYLAKPVRPEVLLARIHALLRRTSGGPAAGPIGVLRVGAVELDPQRRVVRAAGAPVDLTDAEFTLLKVLMVHAGAVVSRDALSLVLTGRPHDGRSRRVDQVVVRVRRKLGDDGRAPLLIKTVRGGGYLLAGVRAP